jgi:hypothetical protein
MPEEQAQEPSDDPVKSLGLRQTIVMSSATHCGSDAACFVEAR